MRELRPGLWHWKAPHPDWRPSEPWDRNVSSYAIDDGERLLLFDPIDPPNEIETLAAKRETAVVLTAPWHERETRGLVERLGVPVYTPLPDSAEYLMETYDLTAEQVGEGSPDVAGDRLDVGLDTFPGQKPNDIVLWVENHRAVVSGDTLVDFGRGLQLNTRWLDYQGIDRNQALQGLQPLLVLPVEHVLAAHGGPFERADLERVLASA